MTGSATEASFFPNRPPATAAPLESTAKNAKERYMCHLVGVVTEKAPKEHA
jgi:hypothetical protein